MSKTKLIPKHKIGYILDYDPKNPYHVHSNGEKIVITPEQYEKHKDEPYFANIRKQVEEHQAAYPGPEYTETLNPEYHKVYANVRAASNQHFKERNFNGQIYREYSVVPEPYFLNSADGVVTDNEGNLYRPMTVADAGKGVTPMFTTTERSARDGREYDMQWVRVKTPSKTIRTLKQPLPVDRTFSTDDIKDFEKYNNYNLNKLQVQPLDNSQPYYSPVYVNYITDTTNPMWGFENDPRVDAYARSFMMNPKGTITTTMRNMRGTVKDIEPVIIDAIENKAKEEGIFRAWTESEMRNAYKAMQDNYLSLKEKKANGEEVNWRQFNGMQYILNMYPTVEGFLNANLLNKNPSYQNGGNLLHKGVNRVQKLIAKKINDRVPGHEGELYSSPTDRTETFNSSVIPIYLSTIQSYKENDDNYVERLYNFYQDAMTNPNSEEIIQNYKNITNQQFDVSPSWIKQFAPIYLAHEDAKSKYLGFPQRGNTVIESEHKPSKAKEQNTKYFKFKYQTPSYWSPVIKDMIKHNRVTKQYPDSILNTFTAEKGVDPNKGEYISIYDIWDYNTKVFGGGEDNIGKYINGTPFEIYDRIYLDDYHNVNTSPEPGTYYGRWLPEVHIIDFKNNKNDKNNES